MTDNRAKTKQYLKQLAETEPEIILDYPLKSKLAKQTARDESSSLIQLEKIALQCRQCGLAKSRQKVVFGVGNPDARLMFIGEAPGADEDRKGEPFVGRAGKKLDDIIRAMKTSRQETYIANILKCRPPGNRNPQQDEIEKCTPFLHRQIEIVDPMIIVALGLVAARHLLDLPPSASIRSMAGRFINYNNRAMIVTYHPAALLRNPSFKRQVWEDVQLVMKLLSGELRWTPEAGIEAGS